jgi:hypothetical protein
MGDYSQGALLPQDLQELVDRARKDAADRTGSAPEDWRLNSLEHVDWPDGALGLPEPGKFYTQATVPGEKIVLESLGGGVFMEYHTGYSAVKFAGESFQATLDPPRQDVDSTRLEIIFVEGQTREAMEEILAEAVAKGALEAKLTFPTADPDEVAYRFGVVKLPDSAEVQRTVSTALQASKLVESVEPTPRRWLTGGASGLGG